MKTVFLAIPNQILTSDLLRTKYIEYLSSKYRVLVITPFIDDLTARRWGYLHSSGVSYALWTIKYPNFWRLFKFLRVALINEFDHLSSIKYYYQRPIFSKNWKLRFLRLISNLCFKKITASFFTKVENFLLPSFDEFSKLVVRHQPIMLITATPGLDPWEAELILLAKRKNVSTIAMNFSWDNLTMNSKHVRKTDYLIAWNNIVKDEAINIHGYNNDRVFVSGTLRFDPYFDKNVVWPGKEEFLKSKGLNPKYPTIFHTTVTKAYPFQKKYIRDLIQLRESKKIPYVNFLIRIHPMDVYENYNEFLGTPNLVVEKAGSEVNGKVEMSYVDLLNLRHALKYSDLNINYASTISIEACIFDKPIINIGCLDRFTLAYDFDHYRPIAQSEAVRISKTDEDLPGLINSYLRNPALDQEHRQWVVENFIGFTDGKSYKRSVDLLERCLSK